MKYLTVIPIILVMALGGSKAQSKPIVLIGNQYGVWSPSHPELMRSTPIFSAQDVVLRNARTLEPLPPLPPLTEFYNGQSTPIH